MAQTLCPASVGLAGGSGWRHWSSSALSEERRGSREGGGREKSQRGRGVEREREGENGEREETEEEEKEEEEEEEEEKEEEEAKNSGGQA